MIIQGIINLVMSEGGCLNHYKDWFYNQQNPADIQIAFSDISMFLSITINDLYRDLDYRGEEPLTLEYSFLYGWDLVVKASIPQPTTLEIAEKYGDYIPEKQRRFLS